MNLIRSLLLLSIACCVNTASAMEYYLVTGDQVNVRKGPSQKWNVVGKASKDQLVLETRREGLWSEVFFLDQRKRKVLGWMANQYLTPQTLAVEADSAAIFDMKVSAGKPVCADRSVVGVGSLCYLDVQFRLLDKGVSRRKAVVTCWADFVVPGDKSVTPIQANNSQSYHLIGGRAEGVMRLNAGLKQHAELMGFNVAYYNCSAK